MEIQETPNCFRVVQLVLHTLLGHNESFLYLVGVLYCLERVPFWILGNRETMMRGNKTDYHQAVSELEWLGWSRSEFNNIHISGDNCLDLWLKLSGNFSSVDMKEQSDTKHQILKAPVVQIQRLLFGQLQGDWCKHWVWWSSQKRMVTATIWWMH